MILSYKIHNVAPYINWIYFFHAWGFQPRFAAIANIHGCDVCRASWLTTFPEEDRNKASEAMQLFKEANRMLDLLDKDYEVRTIFKLCKANSDGDNLVIEKETGQFLVFPLLRQQTPKRDGSPFLCLSDFIRPLSSGIPDTIGAFASCIDADMEGLYEQDPYKHLLVQTLSDRLAEAVIYFFMNAVFILVPDQIRHIVNRCLQKMLCLPEVFAHFIRLLPPLTAEPDFCFRHWHYP